MKKKGEKKVENWKLERKSYKIRRGPFFFSFLLFTFQNQRPKSKWRKIKIGYLAAILKHFILFYFLFFFDFIIIIIIFNYDIQSAYIYGINFSAKFR